MGGTELEDGRACYCKDDASIDPDIALSYIDEKLKNVLGHFQKDFEGGVSAENLGAKFGGYGSFLPTYQRSSSVRSHPKTPQSAHNYSTPHSPNYLLSESSTVPAPASHGNHLYPNVASADASNKRKPCMMPVQLVEEGSSIYNPSAVRLVNPTDQKSLKVRLRVNCNRTRNNAAIYSGLGLVSPSSSIGNSLDESGGMPTGSQQTPYRSPSSILHDMTSFPVPGGLLLSPLDEKLLCLITKETLLSERKLVLPIKGRQKNSSKSVDFSSSVLRDEKQLKENNTRSVDKHEAVEKNVNAVEKIDDKTDILAENDEQTEMLESKQLWTTNLKFKMPSNSLHDADNYLNVAVMDPEGSRKTKLDVPMKKRGMKKHWVEDKLFPIKLANKDSLGSISGQGNSKTVQKEIKSSSMEQTTQRDSLKNRGVVTIKSSRVSSLSKADSHASMHKKDSVSFNMDHHEKVYSSTPTSHELMLHDVELENKSKRSESIPKVASDLPEEKMRPGGWAVMRDKKGVQSDVCKVRDTNKGALDIGLDNMKDQMKSLKMPDRGKVHDHEAVRIQEDPTEAVSAHIELAPAAPMGGDDHWVCCDLCEKWRLLPYGVEPEQFPEKWLCSMLYWLPGMNHCEVDEDVTTAAVMALPQYPVPQFQDNLQNHADRAISGITSVDGHLNNNQNLNFDAMPYPGKKKSKSNLSSSSSVPIQISHKSVNVQEDALSCITCNFLVERQETKLKGKHVNSGDIKSKMLKSKRESDEYNYRSLKKARVNATLVNDKYWTSEHAGDVGPTLSVVKGIEKHREQLSSAKGNPPPSGKLVNSVNRQRDSTQASAKSVSLDRKTCDERELHAKKRKLKDWQDSQTCIGVLGGNGSDLPQNKIIEDSGSRRLRKEKKLRMSTTVLKKSNVDERPVKKGTVGNIFILASGDNSVGRSHEKDRKKGGQRGGFASQPTLCALDSSKKDLGTERFPVAATSSSSKVSDSHRRVSLPEIRGSPVESVSSSPTRLHKQDRLSPSKQGVSTKYGARNGDVLTVSPRKSLDLEATFESNQSGQSKNGEAYGFLHTQSSGLHVQHCGASDTSHRFDGETEPSARHSNHMSNHGADMSRGQRQDRIYMQSSDHGDSEGRLNIELDANGAEFPKKPIRGSPPRSNNKNRTLGFQRVKLKISDPLIERELIPEKMQMTEVDSCKPPSHSEELTEHRKRFSIECSAKSNDHKKSAETKDSGRWENDSREEKPIKLAERVGLHVKLGVVGDGRRIALKKDVVTESESVVSKKRDADHIRSRGGKLESNPHHANKLEESALVPQQLLGTQEGNGIGVRPLNGSADYNFSNGLKRPGNALHQNGAHSTLESVVSYQSTVKVLKESSSVKETSGQTATSALKLAENFSDDANRYKEAGFHIECNEANFQAALQFLCSASLQEASSSSECSKQGEMNPVQMYITAAKLLQNCAHEFEKQKEMAAAALAYKCMEVAYMKVVYCQSSTTNRDRHDLQATLQMVTQGESPSSSASDVDNLNNQATMDKAAFSRGIVHAGNHIIVARSRPNFSRLLDFTRDVSSAMEASRKSQSAYTAAKVTLEEAQNKEGIISIKKVMDFSFHDVEELVRLVKHAAVGIRRRVFSGNKK